MRKFRWIVCALVALWWSNEGWGKPRLVLHTIAGDILVQLDPKLAPQHTRQIMKLVLNGVYDGVHFHRAEPGFVLQLANASDRLIPLNPIQKSLIENIPLEVSSVKHERGVLSMARWEEKPDSAQTSFSILLGPAPHLDGKYTVIGRVLKGMDVVDALVQVPKNGEGKPAVRLGLAYTELVDPGLDTGKVKLVPAVPIGTGVRAIARESGYGDQAKPLFQWTVLILLAVAILGCFLPAGWSSRPLWLISATVGGFPWLVWGLSHNHRSSWLGFGIFAALIFYFKVMSGFEFSRSKPTGRES